MRIENKKDMALVKRAQNEGWAYDKTKVVAALMEVVEQSPGGELMLMAIDRLQKGDEIEVKRQLMELKKAGDENSVRLQLLELARNIEPVELARLASENGIISGAVIK